MSQGFINEVINIGGSISGSASTINVQEDGSTVVSNIANLNFSSSLFNVSGSGTTAIITPSSDFMQPVISEWTSYVPVVSGGFGTATSISAQWRRVGSSMEVQGEFVTGTVGASIGTVTLPLGYNSVNTDQLYVGMLTNTTLGLIYGSSTVLNTTNNVSTNGVTSTTQYTFSFTVPIQGWSAQQTANLIQYQGKVVQVVDSVYSTKTTTTSQIPQDNTIPQITEGFEIFNINITPTNVNSKLVFNISANIQYAPGGGVICLFKNSNSNSIYSRYNSTHDAELIFVDSPNTTSSINYSVRAGCGGTTYINTQSGGDQFGDTMKSFMTITEILP